MIRSKLFFYAIISTTVALTTFLWLSQDGLKPLGDTFSTIITYIVFIYLGGAIGTYSYSKFMDVFIDRDHEDSDRANPFKHSKRYFNSSNL